MLHSKTLLMFLLKALLIYGALSAPFSFYDEAYGSFYRKVARIFFTKFRENGAVKFREWNEPAMTHINVGSYAVVNPNGTYHTTAANINTRYMGYIPTILLISLVLASPVPWKRRLVALVAGLSLVMLLIIFKQWIALLWLCEQNSWLHLTDFTKTGAKFLSSTNSIISASTSTVLYFVVAIWILVTFRVDDFKTQKDHHKLPADSVNGKEKYRHKNKFQQLKI